MNLIIKTINISDVETISKLYKKVFDNTHFTVCFSNKHLETYFSSLIKLNDFCFIAEIDDEVVGFLIGGFRTQEAVEIFMRKNMLMTIYYLITNPKFIYKTVYRVIYKKIKHIHQSRVKLRLFIIGVNPNFTNKGIGKALISHYEYVIKSKGFTEYGLYVRNKNRAAISFYEKLGFELEFKTHESYGYTKKIN